MKNQYIIGFIFILFIGSQTKAQFTVNQQLLILKTDLLHEKTLEAQQFIEQNITLWTPELLIEKGNIFYQISNFKEALNCYLVANQQNQNLGTYQIAACYARIQRPEQACEFLKRHLQEKNRKMLNEIASDAAFQSIENTKVWKELWETEWYSKYELMLEEAWNEYRNKRYPESLEILNQLTEIRKSMTGAFYLKALVYEALEEYDNAIICIDYVLNRKTAQARDFLVKSRLERKALNLRKASKAIELALENDSTQIEFYLEQAKIQLALEQEEAALKHIDFLLTHVPDEEMYLLASDIYTQAGELSLAIKALNQCILTNAYQPQLYIRRGDLYTQTHLFEFAEKDYTMVLDFEPLNGELYFKRGKARLGMGNRMDACFDFQKAYSFQYTAADAMIRQYCQPHLK